MMLLCRVQHKQSHVSNKPLAWTIDMTTTIATVWTRSSKAILFKNNRRAMWKCCQKLKVSLDRKWQIVYRRQIVIFEPENSALLQHKPSSTPCLEIFPCNLENKPTQQITSKNSKKQTKTLLNRKNREAGIHLFTPHLSRKVADGKSESNPVS